MSCKLISGSEPSLRFYPKPMQSMLQICPSNLSFNTHLPKSSISMKTSCGSYRTRTKAAINVAPQSTESYYELLGVSQSGSLPEIKKAYKKLARKYHPDVSPAGCTEEYTRKFIRVQEAYETLSDPNTRAMYDMDVGKGVKAWRSGVERVDWMNLWQSQLMELKRRTTMNKDSRGNNMSWGARIRRRRSEAFC